MEALLPAIVAVVATSFVCSLVVTPFVARLAWSLDAVSRPDGARRLHGHATPLWGGVAVCFSMASGVAVVWMSFPVPFSRLMLPLGISMGLLCLLGLWDDHGPLPARWKLPGQIAATLPIVLFGFYPEQVMLFGTPLELGWFGAVCTVAWLLLGINALNLIDGMDGLASVIGIVTAAAIAVIAGLRGNPEGLLLSVALLGGLAGFLFHNLPPAKIFLGDSGSMVIGLVLSFLALRVSLRNAATANAPVLALLLFVPLLDTGLAVVRRILKGQNIFSGDRGHLHHQLLDRGFGVWKTLTLLSGFCLLATAAACSAVASGRELLAWGGVIACTVLLVYGQFVGRQETFLLWELLFRSRRELPPSGMLREPATVFPERLPLFSSKNPGPSAGRPADETGRAADETGRHPADPAPSKQRAA